MARASIGVRTDLLLPATAVGTAAALGLAFLRGAPWPPTGAWLAAACVGVGRAPRPGWTR